MNAQLRLAALGAAAGLVCLVSVPARADTQIIKVVERAETDAVTDLGDKDDSVGDILTFANPIYDEANANEVGSDNGWCIRTAVGKAWECFWTITLGGGQITVEGPFYDAGDSVLAVTGGTGAYSGARGEMALHARNPEGSEYDFTYSLIR